ncbi:MAG: hypothetical protein D6730_16105 [Bacteroidetes bacterium]|nr:MAG: hypothetical protein D6730_16105 [Bacteroidota bacterium]
MTKVVQSVRIKCLNCDRGWKGNDFGVKKEEDEDEIVWEKPLSIPKALYRWDSKAAVANAVKNGIKKTGGPLDGIPTLATSSTAAAVNSGANDVSARMKIDTSKIPDFENNFRYTPTKKGPKEVKVMVSIPAEAITKV